jgi:hypothetical protein
MNYTKRLTHALKLLLATVFAVCLPLTANAFYDSASGLYFSSSNGTTCSVTALTNGTYSGDIVIPSTVTYNDTEYKVTAIGENAFESSDITSVTIPKGVTTIGDYTFEYCTSLTSLTIPEGVTSIGNNTFMNSSLVSVTLPESVTEIGYCTFGGCNALTSINIPKGLTTIPKGMFQNCYSLTSITIPYGVKIIDYYAFSWCENLTTVEIPESVTEISAGAFAYCTNLKGVTTKKFTGKEQNVLIIPNSVKTIGELAFCRSSLENIWIGNGCTSIGWQAFAYNGNLETVTCMAYPAPILATQDVFDDTDYANAYLYIYEGDDEIDYSTIYDSYADTENNYWYLFLKGKGISVGVNEVANEDVTITTDGMAINVVENEGNIEVYNVAGMKVYQGNDSRIELPNTGIYAVIVNGKSYKIAIK